MNYGATGENAVTQSAAESTVLHITVKCVNANCKTFDNSLSHTKQVTMQPNPNDTEIVTDHFCDIF